MFKHPDFIQKEIFKIHFIIKKKPEAIRGETARIINKHLK